MILVNQRPFSSPLPGRGPSSFPSSYLHLGAPHPPTLRRVLGRGGHHCHSITYLTEGPWVWRTSQFTQNRGSMGSSAGLLMVGEVLHSPSTYQPLITGPGSGVGVTRAVEADDLLTENGSTAVLTAVDSGVGNTVAFPKLNNPGTHLVVLESFSEEGWLYG